MLMSLYSGLNKKLKVMLYDEQTKKYKPYKINILDTSKTAALNANSKATETQKSL